MAKQKRPPMFKVRAEVDVWYPTDDCPRPVLRLLEERLGTSRWDLLFSVREAIKRKLAHFGIDPSKVEIDFERLDFFASRSRTYSGSVFDNEPEWVEAIIEDAANRDKAIRALTYLPYDLQEQHAIYGA